MSERKKKSRGMQVAMPILFSAAAVCVTVLLVGVLASFAVVRGWMQTDQLKYAALIGLGLGAMLGGTFLCVKTKGVPILCGAAVGGVEALICLFVGVVVFGAPTGMGVLFCSLPSLIGGCAGGMLCAMFRIAHRR